MNYKHPTGTLRFGKIDVTEAQYGIIGLHLLTFIFGSSMWQQNVSIFRCNTIFWYIFVFHLKKIEDCNGISQLWEVSGLDR